MKDVIVVVTAMENPLSTSKKEEGLVLTAACHPSTFFSTAATCLCALLAVVNIVVFTLLSASITYVGTQIAELL